MHSCDESLPVLCQCCRSFASVTINITDMSDYVKTKPFPNEPVDSKLLHEPITRDMLLHEPYTPESADSHSPNPEIVEEDNRRNSVSPSDLKNRLEDIIRTSQSPIAEIKRSGSQGIAVLNRSEDDFRHRTMSETVKRTSRARLISSVSVTSTVRLQSHHSSSGEEWFEFDENSNSRNSVKEDQCKKETVCENLDDERKGHTKDEMKRRCCCVLM